VPASSPDPPEHPERVASDRTAGYGSRLPWGIVVVLSLIIVAIVKPWDFGRPTSEGPRATAASAADASGDVGATPQPGATPAPTLEPGALSCSNYDAWRAVTVEQTRDEEVHRWIAVDPVAARDPLDPAIPSVRVVVGRLEGIGFCPPDSVVAADVARVYRVDDGRAERVGGDADLTLLVPTGHHAARVFRPPSGIDAWAPGLYVVEVPIAGGSAGGASGPSSMWFDIQVDQTAPSRS
jgi:hypothetical protein